MLNFLQRHKVSIIVIFCLLLAGLGFFLYQFSESLGLSELDQESYMYPTATAIFPDGTRVELEIAHTPETQTLGLGQRDFLEENAGMLFPYLESDNLAFWMKGMRFPIDIIWLLDGEIVSISKKAQPDSYPLGVFRPEGVVNQVIEVNAGFSEVHGLSSGDLVDIIVENK